MKNFKKFIAIGASAAMLLGSAIPAFAESGAGTTGGVEGTGTSTGHLDKSYIEASVPTQATVDAMFSFYVDPEDIFGQGGKLNDSAVTKVNDLVYFPAATAGQYAATSQNLELDIKNYVDAQIVVNATIDADTAGLIELVDTAEGISTTEAADAAALYLALKVGSETAVPITAEGATSTAAIAGQPDNFEITGAVGSFTATPKSSASTWSKVAISLSGKAQLVNDATGIVAPKVTLAYEISIPDGDVAPSIATTSYTYTAGEPIEVEFSLGSGDLAATGITSITSVKKDGTTPFTLAENTNYTIDGNKIVFSADQLASLMNINSKNVTITFNDDEEEPTVVVITITKA